MIRLELRWLRFGVSLLLVATFPLAACGFSDTDLWPSLKAEEPSKPTAKPATAKGPAKAAVTAQAAQPRTAKPKAAQPPLTAGAGPQLGTTQFEPMGVTPGKPTGTFVGKKVVELRKELRRLQQSVAQNNAMLQKLRAKIVQDSQKYHGTVAAINTRLQVGTTPGNPILVQQYNTAQAALERIRSDTDELNRLATKIAADSTKSGFLAESVRAAFNVSGALDEDHRQLAILEDEVNRTLVLIERLLNEVTEDIQRQTNYVATERSNLNLIAAGIQTGEIYGGSLVNRAMMSATRNVPVGPAKAQNTAGKRPLVVIRFDREKVPFQQALYNAVSRVLERRPDAVFDLVAVAPAAGGPARVALNSAKARRHAEAVLRALVEMGLPTSRVAVSAKTSKTARTNEVHLYVR